MRLLRNTCYLICATLALGLFACNDLPTASAPSPQTPAADFFDRAPAPGFSALEWREPIEREVVARQVIGPAGGVIQLRGTGVEISFPEGAVSESVLIEARAVPGSVVAFEFGVPGLAFGVPVQVRIDRERLAGPWLEWGVEEVPDGDVLRHYLVGLIGVHFEGNSRFSVTPTGILPIYMDGETVVLEIMNTEALAPETEHFSFAIAGFMGYAVASG